MKKTDEGLVQEIRGYAQEHPADSFSAIADRFGLSEISVKRFCKGLGRSKAWRQGRKAPASDPATFWSRVHKNADSCWLWKGAVNNQEYGVLSWNGRSLGAHRVAWELTNGKIPAGLELDHLCRNRSCVRPDHLEPVTHPENMERAGIILRSKPHRNMQSGSDEAASGSIDTAVVESAESAKAIVVPHINISKINSCSADPAHTWARGSMERGGLTATPTSPARHSAPTATKATHSRATVRRSEHSWSPAPSRPHYDPLETGIRKSNEAEAKKRAEDDAWGISLKKLTSRGTRGVTLSIFSIDVGGFHTVLRAHSREDAVSMFCSVCGPAYRHAVRVGFGGTTTFAEHNLLQLLAVKEYSPSPLRSWRDKLQKEFEEWIATNEGRELVCEVQEAYKQELLRKDAEEQAQADCEFQSHLREEYDAQLEAEKRKQRAIRKSRWGRRGAYGEERRYEKYDDWSDDDWSDDD